MDLIVSPGLGVISTPSPTTLQQPPTTTPVSQEFLGLSLNQEPR